MWRQRKTGCPVMCVAGGGSCALSVFWM